MGAATAIYYVGEALQAKRAQLQDSTAKKPLSDSQIDDILKRTFPIKGLILDSAYSHLPVLCHELVGQLVRYFSIPFS